MFKGFLGTSYWFKGFWYTKKKINLSSWFLFILINDRIIGKFLYLSLPGHFLWLFILFLASLSYWRWKATNCCPDKPYTSASQQLVSINGLLLVLLTILSIITTFISWFEKVVKCWQYITQVNWFSVKRNFFFY